jgi:TonB-dependent starch-binding outer membrane protein SusC
MKRKIMYERQKHHWFKLVTVMLFFMIFTGSLFAQERTVKGSIVDRQGSPLPGVTIVIKGTNTGTITDLNGTFSIKVPDNSSVLETKYVGYISQNLPVGENTEISVVLDEEIKEIDQVVVIGYGTMKKSDLTGSIASVSSEDLQAIPVARIDEALTGRAAGVNVSATSGMPGASRAIQIRGVSSINGFEPLVVIDGIPGGDMNKISPSDIESIEVLKDAASAAIYGATGGNGVILITTKRGKEGKSITTLNMYTGIQDIPKEIDMMNTRQWNQFYAAMHNGRPFIYSEDSLNMNTDWQDAIFDQAPIKNIDFNTSGGTEKIKYSFGTNYLTQKGMVKNTGYEKLLMSMNSIYSISKRITFDEVVRFAYDKTTGPAQWQYQNVYNNFTTMPAIMMVPFLTPYDENGKWSISPVGGNNPFTGIDCRSNQYNKGVEVNGNFGLNIELFKGLTYTSRISGKVNNTEYWNFLPKYESWSQDKNSVSLLTQNWTKYYSWTFQNYVTYNSSFSEIHNFSLILGMEASNWWDYYIGGNRQDYASTNPDLLYFDNSLNDTLPSQIISGLGKEATSEGLFGRINYNYKNWALAQFNYRRDGNSNFGPNNKWGNFFSGSIGVKFSEWDVIKNLGIFSFGKVRIGYGETGQFPVTTYWPYASSILNTNQMNYAFNDASVVQGMGPVQIPNPDLKWETVKTTNIGLDMGFMRDQLTVNIDYFNKVNEDMIMPKQVPSVAGTYLLISPSNVGEVGTTGITSSYPLVNYGSVSNKGIETTVDYKKTIGDFKINANVNFTYQQNEITDLATDSTIQGNVHDLQGVTISKIGQPIGTFRGFEFDGLFRDGDPMVYNGASHRYVFADQPYYIDGTDTIYAKPYAEAGDARWVDRNGDGKWNQQDYTYLGSYIPKFVFGFNMGMEWKGIDFSMFWQGVAGNKIFNGVKRWTYDWNTSTNHAAEFADRYHMPIVYNGETIDPGNLESDLPDVGTINWGNPSSLYIEDGSYLRLRSLTVGYTLPNSWTSKVNIERFRLYFIGKNLMTLTRYTGYDPEVSNPDPKQAGIDISGYPQSKMYTFGINLEF